MLRPRIAILDFCDQQFQNNEGRNVAARLAALLGASSHYRVVERSEWHRLLGGRELSQECRLHPAWAMHIGNLAGTDAVVIGSVRRSVRDQVTVAATMLDASGVILAKARQATVEGLAALLTGSRLASKIRGCGHPVRARVTRVEGALIILNAGPASGLKPGDRLRIDRVLETVSDPYLQDRSEVIGYLNANLGTAEVLGVGPCAALALYSGAQPAGIGDWATLLEF